MGKKLVDILNRCKELNVEFIRFENKNKEQIDSFNSESYVITKCNVCGKILRKRIDHFFTNYGCLKCSQTKQKLSKETIFSRINEKCLRKNYSFIGFCDKNGNVSDWVGAEKTYVKIKCCTCGYIWNVLYSNFVSKYDYGCPNCANNVKMTEEQALQNVLKECEKINCSFLYFCDKNGEKTQYKNNKSYLKLKCNECLSVFTIKYSNFIHLSQGCSNCKKSNGEKVIEKLLKDNSLHFIYRDKNVLNYKKMELDFYIPSLKLGIEIQGGQHFYAVELWGGENALKKQIEYDKIKSRICKDKNIKLLYYSQLQIDFPYHVFNKTNELLEEIKKYENDFNKSQERLET